MGIRQTIGAMIPAPVLERCWDIAAKHFFPAPLLKRPDAGYVVNHDVLLAYYVGCRESRKPVRYCQVGAYDGVLQDPIFPLIEKYGMRGVLLEPQPQAYAELCRNYARFDGFALVNAAVSNRDGVRNLYTVKPDAGGPDWLQCIASFDEAVLMRHVATVPNLASMVQKEQVKTITFETLFRANKIDELDLLQIDTEGYDAEILRLFNFNTWRVPIVGFEHKHLSRGDFEQTLELLMDHGYRISIGHDGNTLACHRSIF